jgi:hypothetical protein
LKCIDGEGKVKIFVVDPGFKALIDDQAEEDRLADLAKKEDKKGRR